MRQVLGAAVASASAVVALGVGAAFFYTPEAPAGLARSPYSGPDPAAGLRVDPAPSPNVPARWLSADDPCRPRWTSPRSPVATTSP